MDLGLRGKVALITGGSKGVGYGIAESLAGEGCNLILVSRTEAELLSAGARLKQDHRVRVDVRAADMSLAVDRMTLAEQFPDIDILVNNAGAIRQGTLEEIDDRRWRDFWELKVFGYINLSRTYFTRMKERRKGVILNVIGIAGERMDSGYIAGSTGNASLMAFTRALGSSSPEFNVRVVGINPGPVMSDKLELRLRSRVPANGDAEQWRDLMKAMPFGRAATPQELGDVAAFLASDRANYVSGTIVTVDGGWTQRWSM